MSTARTSAWLSRRTIGWALYDVASSTYVAVVPTYFGLYFVAQSGSSSAATGVWGAVAATSLVLAGLLSPLVGAYADRTARWIRVIAMATAACVIATLLLPIATRQGLLAAAAAFVVAQVGYTLATSIYDSYVVDISPVEVRGRVSGLGWALGLIGGLSVLAASLWVMRGVPAQEQVQRLGMVFMLAGALFGLLAIPGLAGLRGLRGSVTAVQAEAGPLAILRAVRATLRDWRRHRTALRVLLAFFLINDVLVTLVFFIGIVLSRRFGFGVDGLLWLSLLFHAIALPSTIAFGVLADRHGARSTLVFLCALLAAAILLLATGRAAWAATASVALLGLVFASIQAVFRSLYAALVPYDKVAELFGFNSIAGRLSAALGPLLFGMAAAALGSQAWALCLLLIPLAAGVVLLRSVQLPPAREPAGGNAAELATRTAG